MRKSEIDEVNDYLEILENGKKWEKKYRKQKYYIINSKEPIVITPKTQCPKHMGEDLLFDDNHLIEFRYFDEEKTLIPIRIHYCKYCGQTYMSTGIYEQYKRKGIFLTPLVRDGKILSDLSGIENEDSFVLTKDRTYYTGTLFTVTEKNRTYFPERLSMKAEIPVKDGNDNIVYCIAPVFFSHLTRMCYISIETINRLKEKGMIMCRLCKATSLAAALDPTYNSYSIESVIHNYGYNVDSRENLTDEQRHEILMSIITNVVPRRDVMKHLEFLINLGQGRDEMCNAVNKWMSDYKYLKSLPIDIDKTSLADNCVVKLHFLGV